MQSKPPAPIQVRTWIRAPMQSCPSTANWPPSFPEAAAAEARMTRHLCLEPCKCTASIQAQAQVCTLATFALYVPAATACTAHAEVHQGATICFPAIHNPAHAAEDAAR